MAAQDTRDTGKLLREMRGQLGSIPEWFYYFSGLADKLEGTTIPVDKPNFLVYTRREPAGVVAAITPWNSPLLLLCWKLAPALAAGCTMVAKPSDYSPASAVELAALMDEAGFPPGVFNVVTGFGPAVGKALAGHPDVDKVAFTGSTAVGAEVAKAAPRTSPVCCWSSAASPRTWSSTTPTWTRRATGRWPGCSRPPGRPAWPGPGCSCTPTCTTSWSERSPSAPRGSSWATRTAPGPRWARSRPSRSTARCCLPGARPAEGATVAYGRPPRASPSAVLRPADGAHRGQADHDRGV
jgi:hypothetical protein